LPPVLQDQCPSRAVPLATSIASAAASSLMSSRVVDVEGDGGGTVSKPSPDLHNIDLGGNQRRCMRVPQGVKRHPRQPACFAGAKPASAQVVGRYRLTGGPAEHQGVRARPSEAKLLSELELPDTMLAKHHPPPSSALTAKSDASGTMRVRGRMFRAGTLHKRRPAWRTRPPGRPKRSAAVARARRSRFRLGARKREE
jgi:hypothetical protein